MSAADVQAGKLLSLSKLITEEDLSSQADNSTIIFTIANNYVVGTMKLFLNGLRIQKGAVKDYVETAPNQVTFVVAPLVGDIVLADYIKV